MGLVKRKCYNIGDRVLFLKEKIFREGIIQSYKYPYYLIQTEKHPIPFSVKPSQIQQKLLSFEFSIP